MHGKFFPAKSFFGQFTHDREPYAAKENQSAGDKVQKQAVLIGDKVAHAAQNIKSGVIKGCNGMKKTDSNRFQNRIVLCKYRETEYSARQFKSSGDGENFFQQPYHAAIAAQVHGLPKYGTSLQIHSPAHGQHDPRPDCSYSQPAGLNQKTNNGLPQRGEGIGGIYYRKSCNTYGAGGGIQSIYVPERNIVPETPGQHQYHRTQKDQQRKTNGNKAP